MELCALVKWVEQICRWCLFICLFFLFVCLKSGVCMWAGVLEGATLCGFIDQLIN